MITNLFRNDKLIIKLLYVFLLINLVFIFYFLTFKQFFQQDEWLTFTNILSKGVSYLELDRNLLDFFFAERTGAKLIFFSLFNTFGINPLPYGLLSFVLHITNTGIIFLISKKLTRMKLISLFAAIFFLVNEVGNEAYSWFSAMNSTAPALLFFLLSLYFYIKFLEKKDIESIIVSFLLLLISLFFKEAAVFAFILYPFLYLIYKRKEEIKFKEILKSLFPFLIIGAILTWYFLKSVIFITGDRANYVESGTFFIQSLLNNSVRYPFEGIIQTIIPNALLFKLSPFTTLLLNPHMDENSLEFLVASQNLYAELTILSILTLTALALYLFLSKYWKKLNIQIKFTLWASLFIALLSFLPHIVLERSFSYFDSRHYYFAASGISIFLATLFLIFFRGNKTRRIIAYSLVILYISVHEFVLFSDFKLLADRSSERQNFLKQIETLVPHLNQKTVFFITSNSEGYYGLEELKIPFQSGFGNVLLVFYANKGQVYPSFLKNLSKDNKNAEFLYDILGQGYKETDKQGFGYYYDKGTLNEAIKQDIFSSKDVISLFYDSQRKRLKKTSND